MPEIRAEVAATGHAGRLARYEAILSITAKHGFAVLEDRISHGAVEPEVGAVQLREALEELGTVFIKLGQFVSAQSANLPAAYREELAKLDDDVPALPADVMRSRIEASLGEPVATLFASFDDRPLGSASIGQVHAATLPDGREVVVKVRKPGVEELVALDLAILREWVQRLQPHWRLLRDLRADELMPEFARTLEAELDYEGEASHTRFFARHFEEDTRMAVPTVVVDRTRSDVICETRLRGEPLLDGAERLDEAARGDLVAAIVTLVVEPGLTSGTFHADPHAGNLLLTDDHRLGVLDFGKTGRLGRDDRDAILAMMIALGSRDADRLATALLRLTPARRPVDARTVAGGIDLLLHRYGDATLSGIRFRRRAERPPGAPAVERAVHAGTRGALPQGAGDRRGSDKADGARSAGRRSPQAGPEAGRRRPDDRGGRRQPADRLGPRLRVGAGGPPAAGRPGALGTRRGRTPRLDASRGAAVHDRAAGGDGRPARRRRACRGRRDRRGRRAAALPAAAAARDRRAGVGRRRHSPHVRRTGASQKDAAVVRAGPYDAIVVGAGPAGSAAAADLRRGGASVLILDHATFPRDKPCAGALTAKAVGRLRHRLGEVGRVEIDAVEFRLRGRRPRVASAGSPMATMTVRREFDDACLRYAQSCGAEFVADGLASLEEGPSGVTVRTSRGEVARARYVVGADGAASRTRRLIGAPAQRRALAIEGLVPADRLPELATAMLFDVAAVAGGYGWAFGKGDHVNVGLYVADGSRSLTKADLAAYAADAFGIDALHEVRGAALGVGAPSPTLGSARVLLAGDAAGTAERLLGEGIHNALASGQAAAAAILTALRTDVPARAAYAEAVRPVVVDLALCDRVASGFYRWPAASCAALGLRPVANRLASGFASRSPLRRIVDDACRRRPVVATAARLLRL